MSAALNLHSDKAEIVGLLRACALLTEASDEALRFAAEHVETVSFQRGESITLEREFSDSVYFITRGSVEIVSFLLEENRIERRALLTVGQHFGEFSAMTNSTRSGSVYAFSDSTLFRMPGAAFLAILRSSTALTLKLAKMYAAMNSDFEAKTEIVPYRLPAQIKVSSQLAAVIPPAMWEKFKAIPISNREGVCEVVMTNPHNQEFFRFAKQATGSSQFQLSLISEPDFEEAVTQAKQHLKRGPTTGSTLVAKPAEQTVPDISQALRRSPLYGCLPVEVLTQIAENIQPMAVAAGALALRPGSEVQHHFVVASGKIELLQPLPSIEREIGGENSCWSSVMTLSSGDDFSDVQLLLGGKFGYAARATEDAVLIAIPQSYFEQLTGYIEFTMGLAAKLAKRLQFMSHIAGTKFLKDSALPDWKAVAELIPITVITEEKVIPVRLRDHEIVLCSVSSDNNQVSGRVSRYLGQYRIKQYSVRPAQFSEWLVNFKAVLEAADEGADKSGTLKVVRSANAKIDIVKWVDAILLLGMKNRASDIHFEPAEDKLHVRFRIDGVLREHHETLPFAFAREVANRLKILSEMDISVQFVPQDGQLKTKVADADVVARVSCVPVRNGEKFVLRLVRSQNAIVPLAMIAPDRRIMNILNGVTKSKQGLFLVTGPTGSGKTTTLYSILNAINDIGVNITTLEDPVEMEIRGFNQIEVDYKRGLDFQKALRSVLRQDPNVIMVGEIRDEDSAKIVFDASITGHLVLSTLHTTSSLDIAPRLLELGVSASNISSGLIGVLTQRLLRANCKKCLTRRPTTASECDLFKAALKLVEAPEQLAHSTGCSACGNTGYMHRLPVLEVWRSTPAMRQAILEKRGHDELLTVARQDGFETLFESALKLVLSGLTSLEEVRRVLGGF